MGAVFHDVGLRDCPADVLMKPEPLDPKDRTWIEQHPMRSVEYLLNQRSFSKSTLSQMIVAFEHHRNFDGSGYPYGSRRPDIFSRIVTIADVYDAMTTQRPWRNAFMPDEALGMMSREANRRFDPALMKVFVNTLGLYPVGTLVRLDSGDLGIVIYGGGEGERLNRPIISLLGRDGKPAGNVDLAERSPAGAYRWSIVMTEDPKKFGIQPSGIIADADRRPRPDSRRGAARSVSQTRAECGGARVPRLDAGARRLGRAAARRIRVRHSIDRGHCRRALRSPQDAARADHTHSAVE